MTLDAGTIVGRYRILGLLGRGGMADVYKAHQSSLDRVVALKVIRAGATDDPAFAERFAREARAVAKLEHPNIVPVFDFEEVDGRSLLVMQFLDAGTLKERLADAAGPLPPKEVGRIVRGIADALDHAHAHGIIHRDIKPSNVMLTAGGRVMVTDFGIAKILGTATTQYTQTAVSIGTPDYMSPEQGQGLAVDRRSDVYALGAVAYEMLSGRVPFAGDTPVSVMLKHIRDPLPRARDVNPSVTPATDAVLAKSMAKSADQRYATAGEFAAALDDSFVAPAETIVMNAATTMSAAPARRLWRPVPLIAAGMAVLGLAGGGIVIAAGALSGPVANPSPSLAAPSVSSTASATPAEPPTVAAATTVPPLPSTTSLPISAGEITNCLPSIATAGTEVTCKFVGMPPRAAITEVTFQNEGQPARILPYGGPAALIQPDGTWAFYARYDSGPKGTVTVTVTAGGVTKAMQYQQQ